ncbi:MAG: 30S ribosomal protein S16 [Proteobacteria bacterium]|nr:30S ribosomal protein S16 [Pseudomonadota bacterium]NDC23545.1 30S ribosomal protein S16 [Pseudomonadota bacterium]NDD03663.1 30S ribosomal protein S16 [Pseudomonadota bacterium]NDG25838.1 30S ribosomal protein S16 [Pseudomonadota bacterium]
MATVIRFSRHGSKKRPVYRIVVQHNRAPRDGRFIEHIGNYNPVKGESTLSIERNRLEYWLSVGAQMSDSVRTTLKPKLAEWKSTTPEGVEAKAAPKKAPAAKKPTSKKKEGAAKASEA